MTGQIGWILQSLYKMIMNTPLPNKHHSIWFMDNILGRELIWEISPQALDLYTQMKEIHSEAIAANKMAKETMKWFYDRTKGKSIDYIIGEKVWLEGKNLKTL